MATIAEALRLSVGHLGAGRLAEAEQICQKIIESCPEQHDAWHLLGVIALQTGHPQAAIDFIRRALLTNPADCTYYGNLGLAQAALGNEHDAMASYQLALTLRPDYADAHFNLGTSLRRLGRLDEAVACYQRSLQLKPECADVHNNLGVAMRALGRLDDAIAHYRAALAIQPSYVQAHFNLANLLSDAGNFDAAVEHYQVAIKLKANFIGAYTNCGVALRGKCQLDEAIAFFHHALRLNPQTADARFNLGAVLQELGQLDEAIAMYRDALPQWPDRPKDHSNLLLLLNYDPTASDELLWSEHVRWAEMFAQPVASPPMFANLRDPARRLRIGYVSPDFREHAAAKFIERILTHHDHQRHEIFLYAGLVRMDETSKRFQKLTSAWRPTWNMSDEQLAAQIREDQIDILVDLAGHTAGNRLLVFGHRVAPVQITYLGYPNTTGMREMDYRLTDAVADPVGETSRYTEQLIRLEPTFSCFCPSVDAPEPSPPPTARNGQITFGSLHHLARLNDRVIDLWCRLLRELPTASMIVLRSTLLGTARDRILREFLSRGIDATRLDLRSQMPRGQSHLAAYAEIDIALDTFPWSGHTTACESLWMGVPVITWCGSRHASRMVASTLSCLGLHDWIAHSPEEYVAIAVRHARDRQRLAELRGTLRTRMANSPLCDGAKFTHNLEQAYRTMWHAWCEQWE